MELTGDTALLAEEFDVKYHPDYLGKFLRVLCLSYAKIVDRIKYSDCSGIHGELRSVRRDSDARHT